ncbi:ArsR/SmtB family transcription factor [Agromyces bauzanensis]
MATLTAVVHPFEILAHPVRRRVVEVLAVGDHSSGTLSEIAATEFGTSRTAVAHHLAVLREHGAVWSSVDEAEPRSRAYRLNPEFLASLDAAIGELFERWEQRYGTAEERGPSFRIPADREHRLGEAERRHRRDALAEWRGEDPEAEADPEPDAS